jgi:serine phosphatase RsbU (regulator of sigma subunit)
VTARSQPANQSQPEQPFDRTTAIGIGALVIAVMILIALIGLITLLPAQTITQAISAQASEDQQVRAESLARKMESLFFNSIAYDLRALADRPEVKSTTRASRPAALAAMAEMNRRHVGLIRSIVRLAEDGTPVYAWPESLNDQIAAGKPLLWQVDAAWVQNVIQQQTVQFFQQPLTAGGVTYLMVTPITEGTNINEALAVEMDLENYFETNFRSLIFRSTTQLWVFDQSGKELFHYHDQPFTGDINAVRNQAETVRLTGFPSPGQETVIAPVNVAFQQNHRLSVVLTREISEGQQAVYSTLQSLFLFGLAIIGFIVIVGLFVGRFLLNETRRRRKEEQRRSTARTLLEMSRALNSSLELEVVLQRILGELSKILPHDNASVMLLNEEEHSVTVAAETGTVNPTPVQMPLTELRGAREVVMTGKPTLINDCLHDPRWNAMPGSTTQSWLGVPLRVRNQSVGVLNINSNQPNRFQPDDIDLAEAFADQAGIAIENARAHELQIRAYEMELETARAIQTSLLPQEQPPLAQLQLAARAIPARQVSGDYHQYFPLPDGKLGIAVGDVSGKGIPAALLMAVITTALRDEILRNPSPSALLNELNNRLLPRMQQNNMTSALLMSIFDPLTRHVEIANGGMVQPYVRNGQGWSFVPVGGYPLGASSRMSYSSKTVTLAPGSMLLLFSDGVIESQNLQHEFFGFERLEELLNSLPATATADQVLEAILEAVYAHLEGQEPQDDITIVVMNSVEV